MATSSGQSSPSAEAVQKLLHALAHGVRHDDGLAQVLTSEPWSLGEVIDRATELELIRRRHLTDAGRMMLGEEGLRLDRRAMKPVNETQFKRCWCGSCAATGLHDTTAPYYPVSLREGR
ncbi:hypothetical protein [Streptomyces anulatus]